MEKCRESRNSVHKVEKSVEKVGKTMPKAWILINAFQTV